MSSDPEPDRSSSPLGRQLPFAIVLGVVLLALSGTEGGVSLDARTVGAVLFALVATLATVVVPWDRLPRWAVAAVPLADIAAVALLLAQNLAVSALIVLPVVWLARAFPYRGTVPAIAAGVLASASAELAPVLLSGQPFQVGASAVQRLVIVPAVIVSVALVVSATERRALARLELVAGQSALVEEALARSRAERRLLEAVLNTIDVGVLALDADGRVTLLNRALGEQGAAVPDVGESVADLDRPAHRERRVLAADGTTPLAPAERPVVRAHHGETVVRELVWWEAPDGGRSAQRVSAAQLPGEDGGRGGAVVVYQDLTEEMEALAQRDEFVSSVTHELRTPLTSVLGYLDLAREDPDAPETVRRHLDVAVRNAERLELLISNLLVAAREAAGASAGPAGPVDLAAVLADVVESQRPRAADAQVTLTMHADAPCPVEADRLRLTQVVDNLVSNAVKYSRPGDSVTAETWPGPDTVHLRVADTGIGIAAGDQILLFTRFYRAPSVRQGNVPGTGLGLHITRQIVEALGGSITLTSRLGRGTTVDVTLPTGGAR